MEKLTYEDLEKRGIDTRNIAVCKKLRDLGKLGRVKLDESEHRSGLNKHLFDYIEYCGLDVLSFIKEYLSNIQPYMIERKSNQEFDSHIICVIDNLYRVSVYIKADNTQFNELIISFHEDNKRGIAKTNSLQVATKQRYVPIFADQTLGKLENEEQYVVKGFFQRGLKTLPIELPAVKCKEIFIVDRNAIDLQFVSYCNDYIRDLYSSDLELEDFDKIEVFSMLQQISFTSYGRDTFSSMSLLVDSLCTQKDRVSRSVADFALVTFARNLQLTQEQKEDLTRLLRERFKIKSVKEMEAIMQRIDENLDLAVKKKIRNKVIKKDIKHRDRDEGR